MFLAIVFLLATIFTYRFAFLVSMETHKHGPKDPGFLGSILLSILANLWAQFLLLISLVFVEVSSGLKLYPAFFNDGLTFFSVPLLLTTIYTFLICPILFHFFPGLWAKDFI